MLQRIYTMTCVLGVVFLMGTGTSAQTWTDDQVDAWGAAEKLWKAISDRDIESWYVMVSDDYQGWTSEQQFPTRKAENRRWSEHNMMRKAIPLYRLHPLAINLYGDIAILFYYADVLVADLEKKEAVERWKWTDTYRKQGSKWVLIADAGHQVK